MAPVQRGVGDDGGKIMGTISAAAGPDWLVSGPSMKQPPSEMKRPRSAIVRDNSGPDGSQSAGVTIGRAIRRVTAILVLGWLGYFASLLRDCPASGDVCRPGGFATGIAFAALALAVGHGVGWLVEVTLRSRARRRSATDAAGPWGRSVRSA